MTPDLLSSFTPAWFARNAHLQTLWGTLARHGPQVAARAERWATPDHDEVELQRLDAPGAAPDTPRLLLLHGLEGTIRSHYLRGTLALARARGWPADVLIFRGCNGVIPRARRLYHSGETTDLDFVVRRLVALEPHRPLVLAGFSLGGNVLLKWLGEQGSHVPAQVRAAAAVSVPYDLGLGSRQIERGFARVYTTHFLRTLRRKALAKLSESPGLFDEDRLREVRTLWDFDDVVTAPVHGFRDAADYYARSSARQYLAAIQRPTLLVSARDDPFLPRQVLDDVELMARDNRFLSVRFSDHGGHVGFVTGQWPWRARYHAEESVVDFLESTAAGSAVPAASRTG
jgi:predicted alpha/beta-fold hydrolase